MTVDPDRRTPHVAPEGEADPEPVPIGTPAPGRPSSGARAARRLLGGEPPAEEVRFTMVRRGYDPIQVQQHLDREAARIRTLQDELYRVRAQLGAVGPGAVPDGLD